jgi:hypothetical protein
MNHWSENGIDEKDDVIHNLRTYSTFSKVKYKNDPYLNPSKRLKDIRDYSKCLKDIFKYIIFLR